MNRPPRFFITPGIWGDGYEIKFGAFQDNGTLIAALPVQLMEYREGEPRPDAPMMMIRASDATQNEATMQSLLDELWRLGFRPSDIGTAGHLKATQAHLGDMRALVSKLAGVKLP